MFWAIDYVCLALILASAVVVVVARNLNGAIMALSSMGVVLTLLFVVLGALDDAHAEIVVGAIALPTLYLIAIGKARASLAGERDLGEEQGTDARERPAGTG